MRTLIAIPVYNEQKYVRRVLTAVRERADHVLIIDDGSTDATPDIVAELQRPLDLHVIRHPDNAGYGRSLREAFNHAQHHDYDWVITMDCDEQHEPQLIPEFIARAEAGDLDMVSGSRYLDAAPAKDLPPADRRRINAIITAEINERFGLHLTDAFCGFKAHRVEATRDLNLTENGYAFPMQLWVQSVAHNHRIGEIPVDLIYNDLNRTFGHGLDQAEARLNHYRCVLYREIRSWVDALPNGALLDLCAECPEDAPPSKTPTESTTETPADRS